MNKSFKIIDFENYVVINEFKGQHLDRLKCIKKIYHPIYGESLFSTGEGNTIKVWTI